jgi:hypothetical protein
MKKIITLVAFSAVIMMIVISCNTKKSAWPVVLDRLENELIAVFQQMDSTAALISARIAEHPGDTALIGLYLQQELGSVKGVIEHIYITPEGILKIIAPEDYHKVEGTDISYQDHIIKVRETKKPVLSGAFRAVEGFQAVVLAYPILSPEDELLGITALLFRPEVFLKEIISPKLAGIPADIWVMQKNGLILFDFDQEEIGKNLFTDPLYRDYSKSLQTASKLAEENRGEAFFNFPGHDPETPVTNQAFWTTVEMYGMEWRIVLTNPIGDHEIHRTTSTLGLKSAPQRLFELSCDSIFQAALASRNREEVDRFFNEFYDTYPIYAIEWVDSTVTTRFGYPAQYSLENHQIKPEDIEQQAFYQAAVNREETTIEMRLLEGNNGTFRICPVDYKGQNLGSIYYLVIKR